MKCFTLQFRLITNSFTHAPRIIFKTNIKAKIYNKNNALHFIQASATYFYSPFNVNTNKKNLRFGAPIYAPFNHVSATMTLNQTCNNDSGSHCCSDELKETCCNNDLVHTEATMTLDTIVEVVLFLHVIPIVSLLTSQTVMWRKECFLEFLRVPEYIFSTLL